MMQASDLSASRVQALVVTVGLFTFVSVGVAACLALVVGAFYLAVQVVVLLLSGILEACSDLGALWMGADSLVKLVLVGAAVYGGLRLYHHQKTQGGKHAKIC